MPTRRRGRRSRGTACTAAAAAVAIALASQGCLMTRYLAQAADGQLELLSKARPIDEVVRDPTTPVRTAMMLAEIPEIKQFGRSYGLTIRRNYSTYSALGRPAAVWFVGAADPLAFKPLRWCFPIAGCFAGLGWFDEDDGVEQKNDLEAQGYDVVMRPASAYSTGGWFPDPVLSTMLGGGDDALPGLANVILHESVHATVLVPDEPFFNESFASYIADALTNHWIDVRFGPGSPEDLAWTLGEATRLPRTARLLDAYDQLKRVYDGAGSRDQKLAQKSKIIDDLVVDLHLRRRPNNATLTETRVYNGGTAPILAAHRACGDLHSLIIAGKTLTRADFTRTLQDDLTPIGATLAARCKAAAGVKHASVAPAATTTAPAARAAAPTVHAAALDQPSAQPSAPLRVAARRCASLRVPAKPGLSIDPPRRRPDDTAASAIALCQIFDGVAAGDPAATRRRPAGDRPLETKIMNMKLAPTRPRGSPSSF